MIFNSIIRIQTFMNLKSLIFFPKCGIFSLESGQKMFTLLVPVRTVSNKHGSTALPAIVCCESGCKNVPAGEHSFFASTITFSLPFKSDHRCDRFGVLRCRTVPVPALFLATISCGNFRGLSSCAPTTAENLQGSSDCRSEKVPSTSTGSNSIQVMLVLVSGSCSSQLLLGGGEQLLPPTANSCSRAASRSSCSWLATTTLPR
jgi:hypothetical protein